MTAKQLARDYSKSWKHRLGAFLISLYLDLVYLTARITIIDEKEGRELMQSGRNFIYALWHSRQAFLARAHKNTRACALVSMSRDGEYMARLLCKLGMKVVRGSTSKGGSGALFGLIASAKDGYKPVITPDGPRGPARKVHPGIIFLAQKTKLPIIPMACGLSRRVVFNSWDRFEVPLPFSRAVIVSGRPVYITENCDISEKRREIQNELNRITDIADEKTAKKCRS